MPKPSSVQPYYVGIDPGSESGGIGILHSNGSVHGALELRKRSEEEVVAWLRTWKVYQLKAVIEQVHAMPSQGISSSFKFGANYGFLRGLLVGLRIPFVQVTSQKWQKEIGVVLPGSFEKGKRRRKERKLLLLERARQLWPGAGNGGITVKKNTADALLLAHWLLTKDRQGDSDGRK